MASTYHHGDLRRVVLEATLALVEKEGVGRLSMREIARRAGVSHAAPYKHFHDRSAVLVAIAEDGFRQLRVALHDAVERAATPRAAFEACGRAYVAFAVGHPGHFRVMFRPELTEPEARPETSALADDAFQVIVETITVCQKAGLAKGIPAEALALTGWSTMHGLASLLIDGPLARDAAGRPDEVERLARRVARTLARLLNGA